MQAIPYIDIHTHRLISATGILAVENVFATDIPSHKRFPERVFSVGLHPWHIKPLTFEKEIFNTAKFAENRQVLAIGETGLDKLCNVDFKLQEIVFKLQLETAAKLDKPLIIHCVKAFQEIISIYLKAKNKPILIFHGFNNNLQIAGNLLKHRFYLSFGQALLNEKSNAYRVLSQIPDNCFFLETDDSGNSIEEIYAEAARIKGISILKLKKIVFDNFENCFKSFAWKI